MDDHLSEVRPAERGSGCAPDARNKCIDIWILINYIRDGTLVFNHLLVRCPLRGFRDCEQLVCILVRNEALRNIHEHPACCHQHHQEYNHRDGPVTQHHLKRHVVDVQHAFEEPFGDAVEPGVPLLFRRTEEAAAQHGSQRDGHYAGDENRRANGYRELLEQAPEYPAKEKHGDEHGRQRERH